MTKTKNNSGFACMECGHKFRTVKAAEKAAFGDSGCPKCGGSDIDFAPEKSQAISSTGVTLNDLFKAWEGR